MACCVDWTDPHSITQQTSHPTINFFTPLPQQGCLCEEPEGCLAPDHPYYSYTHQGLDALINRFMDSVGAILDTAPELGNMTHPAFNFTWTIGQVRFVCYVLWRL